MPRRPHKSREVPPRGGKQRPVFRTCLNTPATELPGRTAFKHDDWDDEYYSAFLTEELAKLKRPTP